MLYTEETSTELKSIQMFVSRKSKSALIKPTGVENRVISHSALLVPETPETSHLQQTENTFSIAIIHEILKGSSCSFNISTFHEIQTTGFKAEHVFVNKISNYMRCERRNPGAENMIRCSCLKLKGHIKLRESVLVHLIFLF